MFTGWLFCLAAGLAAAFFVQLPGFSEAVSAHLAGINSTLPQLGFLVLGAFLAVLLGLVDDKYALSAAAKFGGQFLIALLAVGLGGVRVNIFFTNPVLVWGASVFWIMLLMNSINFFDNMDGLAVGTITIAMGFFCVIAALNNQYFIAALAAMSCGVTAGFWYYNTSPAMIFMGDSGSHFLGYLAAVISAGVSWFGIDYSLSRFPILMPLFILALPLFDTGMVVLIRTCRGKPFWIGDHNHISHRFVRMGLSRRQAVLLAHLMALCVGLGILPVFWGDFRTAAILVAQAFLFLLVVSILQFALSDRQDTREKVQPDETKEKSHDQSQTSELGPLFHGYRTCGGKPQQLLAAAGRRGARPGLPDHLDRLQRHAARSAELFRRRLPALQFRHAVRHKPHPVPLQPCRGERDRAGRLSRHRRQGGDALHDLQPVPALREDDHQRRNQGGGLPHALLHRRRVARAAARSRGRRPPARGGRR